MIRRFKLNLEFHVKSFKDNFISIIIHLEMLLLYFLGKHNPTRMCNGACNCTFIKYHAPEVTIVKCRSKVEYVFIPIFFSQV